ncbi:MAG: DNA-binding protein Alba [Promethearchaeota archaeon]
MSEQKVVENTVYIGKRPPLVYVLVAMSLLNEGKECTIKARGKSISKAVYVAELLKRKFVPKSKYKDIRLSTEEITNPDGRISNVSSIEIEITPK